jgi:glycosyltransferase involved in cell wall biosynthesis
MVRARTISDVLICYFRDIVYWVTETILLKVNRIRYENSYTLSEESPLISITIPTYDRGRLLVERTLPSIYAQTYKNFEVIIVGDCCVDETESILRNIKDPRVRFVNLKKRTKYPEDPTLRWFISGVAPSNYALKIVRGKWICYFDDDDIMDTNCLENLLRFAQKGSHEFVAGLYEEEKDGVLSIKGMRSDTEPEFGGHSTWLYRSYLNFYKYNIDSWRKSYNRPQDIDLQLRMRRSGVRMESLNKVVVYVKPRPGLTTIGLAARLVKG